MNALLGTGKKKPALPESQVRASLAILVAEDSIVTQDLLKLLLTQRGHKVDVADDGELALEALQTHEYDIVLMDFHLPKMDGLQVVAAFKTWAGDTTKLPHFIGITADVEGFLKHPDNWQTFDLVIAKPIDIVHLCSVVENFERYMGWRSQRPIEGGLIAPTPVVLAEDTGAATSVPGGGRPRVNDKRMKIERGTTELTLANGEVRTCRVLNLSLSGAALQIKARPEIGEIVRVGRTEGRVIRYTPDGVAVEFVSAATLAATRRF